MVVLYLAQTVHSVDGTIHWMNHYPLDNSRVFDSTYPNLDSDLRICWGLMGSWISLSGFLNSSTGFSLSKLQLNSMVQIVMIW